jgi:chorismate mutase/prephenate dehydratase
VKTDRNVKVAFQGEIGAFSESALRHYFGPDVQSVPCRRFSEVFAKVATSELNYGVVPIENSIEGSVNSVYDLFLEYHLHVCGEIIEKIVHCLIVNPPTGLKSIKSVYSHPQALAQCRDFLDKLSCDVVPTFDTAGSVRLLKEMKNFSAAAIASKRAGEMYKMRILVRNIANNPNNFTRFFVLSETDTPFCGDAKTSIIFSAKHSPGTLYFALKEFAERGINLTRIESRPRKQEPWQYNFYLDFEGHRDDPKCEEALKNLEKKCNMIKLLGSYPKAIQPNTSFKESGNTI